MKKLIVCVFLILMSSGYVVGQVDDNQIRQKVLRANVIDSLFVFGHWTEDGQTETQLKYLGKVVAKDGRVFKVMNSCWIWGLSHRATNRLLIYNGEDQYLGNYSLITNDDFPGKLENGCLVFSNNSKDDCNRELVTRVCLDKGLPEKFFLKCDEKFGDFYYFKTE